MDWFLYDSKIKYLDDSDLHRKRVNVTKSNNMNVLKTLIVPLISSNAGV